MPCTSILEFTFKFLFKKKLGEQHVFNYGEKLGCNNKHELITKGKLCPNLIRVKFIVGNLCGCLVSTFGAHGFCKVQ
jgi:hypothetical protein